MGWVWSSDLESSDMVRIARVHGEEVSGRALQVLYPATFSSSFTATRIYRYGDVIGGGLSTTHTPN